MVAITCPSCGSPAWASLTKVNPSADGSADAQCQCCGWAVWAGTTVCAGFDLEPEQVEARVASLVAAAGRRVGRRRCYVDPWDRPVRIALVQVPAPSADRRSALR